MRFLLPIVFVLTACQSPSQKESVDLSSDYTQAPGWTSVFQTMTSDTETSINILRPRLANMAYVVEEEVPGYKLQWKKPRLTLKYGFLSTFYDAHSNDLFLHRHRTETHA